MKINFGKYKNQAIELPKNNNNMRPTTGMAKSIIFNTIGNFEDKIILDLFSGTGSLGFESLSLGAEKVIFIDNNVDSIKSIYKTINKFKIKKENYEIYKSDFRRVLKYSQQEKFDIIFLDPPFSIQKYFEEALFLLKTKDVLKEEGIIVMEIPYKMKLKIIDDFLIYKKSKLGDKDIYFLQKKREENE